jgi:hypothetical protein
MILACFGAVSAYRGRLMSVNFGIDWSQPRGIEKSRLSNAYSQANYYSALLNLPLMRRAMWLDFSANE